jgi:hypothetical protein
MQFYENLYTYIQEYQKLAYDIYSKLGVPYLITYWNVNTELTVWDDEHVMGGPYERVGNLHGMKYDKYLLIPIYFTEQIDNVFEGQEFGYINETETTIVLPSTIGIHPYPRDFLKLTKYPIDYQNDAMYIVEGLEHSEGEPTYWKMRVNVEQTRKPSDLDPHVVNNYIFFDYDKKVHNIPDSMFLSRMMGKHQVLSTRLKGLFDQNSGFYLT